MGSITVGYTIKKQCPKCNFDFGTYDTSAPPSVDSLKLVYGSPFQKCRHCGHEFIDPGRFEPAIHGIERKFTSRISYGRLWFVVIVGLFCAGMVLSEYIEYIKAGSHSYYDRPAWWTLIFTAFAIGTVIYTLSTHKGRVAEAERLMAESIQRFQDPNYVSALKQLGYVPESFVFKPDFTAEEKRELRKHLYEWGTKER